MPRSMHTCSDCFASLFETSLKVCCVLCSCLPLLVNTKRRLLAGNVEPRASRTRHTDSVLQTTSCRRVLVESIPSNLQNMVASSE